MDKILIIAEKPSVAVDFTRALGGFTKNDDYYESDKYVLSSAIGHLLEISAPPDYEVKRGKWSFSHLPVIPPHFDLNPIEKTVARLKLLTRLLKRKDIAGVINACDAGREGELIFNYIVQYAKSRKPVSRLWLQSMTQQAIRDGFANLRTGTDMDGLRDAAMCRSEADWLVGINGTRAMTAFNSKSGGFHLTTVGRVQTPTLAILVEREERIRHFKSKPYWEIEADFQVTAGDYRGKWFDETFAKPKGGAEENEQLKADRLWDAARAQAIQAKCTGQPGIVSEESKPSSQLSPLLFDLTSLQREANGRFGFSAKTTLALAQALYEKHKVLTYPRTDSRYLPEDYLGTVKDTLSMLTASGNTAKEGVADEKGMARGYGFYAQKILSSGWVIPSKRIFNNNKVSDHFAIIPTLQTPKSLSEAEQKLYDMVVKRFLAVFYPAAEYMTTTRITRVENEAFKTEGKVLVNPGWLVIYGREAAQDESVLVKVTPGEKAATQALTVVACQTKPPARYSEATLLSAMEGAGKMIDDEELRAAMVGRGLGTPATRAQIIENLINEQYILREGRELIPTAKAFSLLTLLRGLDIKALTSPELTGEWEWKLGRIERGELTRPQFMEEIAEMTRLVVERARSHESDTVPGDFSELKTPCPRCGGLIRENYKKFQCQNCDYATWKIIAGRQFEPQEMDILLSHGEIGPLSGFRSRMGRAFTASMRLNDDKQPEFDFGNSDQGQSEAVDFSGQQPLGECPKCHQNVYEHGNGYICEYAVGPDRKCDLRIAQVILQQPISREQVEKLLKTGRTDLFKNFVSSRTKRKFSASLVLDPKTGKAGFEFEAKPAKTAKPKTSAAQKGKGTKAASKENSTHRLA